MKPHERQDIQLLQFIAGGFFDQRFSLNHDFMQIIQPSGSTTAMATADLSIDETRSGSP